MSTKKTVKKITQSAATMVLTTGVVTAVGILGFCGAIAISPSIALAWTSFALAGFIEGQVYKENIANGIAELDLLGKRGLQTLITNALDHQLKLQMKSSPNVDNTITTFLTSYQKAKEYLFSFEHKQLTAAQKTQREEALKHIRDMQKVLIDRVLSNRAITDEREKAYFGNLVATIQSHLPTMQRKLVALQISGLISIAGGIGFGLATASSLASAALVIGTSLSAFIWPLAIVASIGYAFLIYHTVADIICNDNIAKWKKTFSKWFPEDTSTKGILRKAAVGALLTLAIALSIAATLATAGTWWIAIKEGAQLSPQLARYANAIRNLLVPISSFTGLLFTTRNSLKSVKSIVKKFHLSNPLTSIKNKWHALRRKESLLEIANPFRIVANLISYPFTCLVFLGHLIAVGLTGDRTPGLEVPSAVAGTAAEFLTDYDYFAGHEHTAKAYKTNGHGEHDHDTIPATFIKIVLSPILLLSAGWMWLSNEKLDFKTARHKAFGDTHSHVHAHHDHNEPALAFKDSQMREMNIHRRFAKQIARTTSAAEREELHQLKDNLLMETNLKPVADKNNLSNQGFFNAVRFLDKHFPEAMSPSFGKSEPA